MASLTQLPSHRRRLMRARYASIPLLGLLRARDDHFDSLVVQLVAFVNKLHNALIPLTIIGSVHLYHMCSIPSLFAAQAAVRS